MRNVFVLLLQCFFFLIVSPFVSQLLSSLSCIFSLHPSHAHFPHFYFPRSPYSSLIILITLDFANVTELHQRDHEVVGSVMQGVAQVSRGVIEKGGNGLGRESEKVIVGDD